MMNFFLMMITLVITLLSISCNPKQSTKRLEIPSTPTLTSDSMWGVVRTPYAKVLGSPSLDSDVSGLLRQGNMVKILIRRNDNKNRHYWLKVVHEESAVVGWLPDLIVELFDSSIQAKTASMGMLKY